MVRCIVMFLLRWENFTSMSFRGFRERCQYLWEHTGSGRLALGQRGGCRGTRLPWLP